MSKQDEINRHIEDEYHPADAPYIEVNEDEGMITIDGKIRFFDIGVIADILDEV